MKTTDYPRVNHLRSLLGLDVVLLPWPKGLKGTKSKWSHRTVEDMESPQYLGRLESGNIGVALGKVSGHLNTIDFDAGEWLERFLKVNPSLRGTLRSCGVRGGNLWLRCRGRYPRSQRIKTDDGDFVGEWRADGNQTIISGTHPAGTPYFFEVEASPVSVDFESINWPDGLHLAKEVAGRVEEKTGPPVEHGAHRSSTGSLDPESPALLDAGPLDFAPLDAASLYNRESSLSAIRASQELESKHPKLSKIVDALISPLLPLETGSRNTVLTGDLCGRLFSAVARKPAGIILEYLIAADLLGGYPPTEAREKFGSAFTALERGYLDNTFQPLSANERETYSALDPRYQDAFRIFRSLALRPHPKYPPPKFFLSCGECAARLGVRDMMIAWRILQKFVRWRILAPLDRGTRHTGGKAAVFAWALPVGSSTCANCAGS